MSENFENKKAVVEEIAGRIKSSKSVVLVSYTKLSVKDVSEIRNRCRENNCEYKVYKNTLVRKAFNDMDCSDFDGDLNGPTAFVFGGDETCSAKVMAKAEKDYDGKIAVKSAYVDSGYIDSKGVKTLADMPTKDEMLAKILGSMQAPIANFAGVLNNLMSGIVRVLDGIAKNRSGAEA